MSRDSIVELIKKYAVEIAPELEGVNITSDDSLKNS